MQLALMLLLALLPLHHMLAQEAGKEEHRMHIKMIRTADGKTVVIDTTFTTATHDELVKAMQAARLDTARLRQLNGKVRAFTLDANKTELVDRLKGIRGDTALLRQLQDVHVRMLGADSLLGKAGRHTIIIGKDSLARTLIGNPTMLLRTEIDSLRSFILQDGKALRALQPAGVERIVVNQIGDASKIDSLMLLQEGKSYIRIDRDINQVEAEKIGMGLPRPPLAIFFVRAKVEDITVEEKQQLKATGAPVEMKSKEELKVEEINYYPNPNNGRFDISFTLKNKGTTVVRILDSKGNEVFVDTVEKLSGEYSRQIDISPFGPGLYFLQVAQNGRYHTKKLLVQ
ncbi:hypothetical protein OB13_17090 [Pontibacter sp. HJ8]